MKENICNFSGTIRIVKAKLYKESDDPAYKQGLVICEVNFYEDSTQTATGFIKGRLTSNFLLDKAGKLSYDALIFTGDGFENNLCEANWTSYKTHKSKKCNWGDYRIPGSGNLDLGAGEFSVNEKYAKSGWETYIKAYSTNSVAAKQALIIEKKKWWE